MKRKMRSRTKGEEKNEVKQKKIHKNGDGDKS